MLTVQYCIYYYEGWSSRPDLVLSGIKLKYYLLLIVARLRTRHAQYDFWAINILCILACEHSVGQIGVENANTRTVHKFLKNFSNDTDVTQQKFIAQLVIQDETCIYNFDSDSEQQSMQWNERISQNCHFISTLRNSVFFSMSNANNRRQLKCTKYL